MALPSLCHKCRTQVQCSPCMTQLDFTEPKTGNTTVVSNAMPCIRDEMGRICSDSPHIFPVSFLQDEDVMLHIQSKIRLAWHVLGVNKKTISIRPVPSNFLLSYLQVVTRCLYYIKPMLYICADRMLTQCHPYPQRINVCLPWDIDDINEITSRLNNSCTLLSHKVLLKNIFVACVHQL